MENLKRINVNNLKKLYMKQIIIILIITFSIYSCKAQMISIEEANTYFLNEDQGIPDNVTSIKDINNKLDEFLGSWMVNYDNKNYQFMISKFESTLVDIPHDILLIRYIISDENNNVLEDTSNLSNDNILVINGNYFLNDSESYLLSYYSSNFNCGQFGDITLDVDNNSLGGNEMKFYFIPGTKMINVNECTEPLTFPFPTDTFLTFTKQ